ncbi:2-amino-3,7-dideoxy-D-threo-hept-6-ulosonate synthase [Microbacterium sp. No. 7]|uniref:2-amino-3,7-dideoxy-D-threo-hept-6-ulosonate synthase n=1 Tax=Microbacterium sp. No. 7 TaxID=1714373 RepID=UPI0006ECE621|nr:2-amino-3,7-dideoxy-D-threo-hept-6-ulosonate synthase [Microbacterium sp. No. 7]ALJ18947.1 hypothetical protein AOA12_03105 [Microbacterium sp. No. 7]
MTAAYSGRTAIVSGGSPGKAIRLSRLLSGRGRSVFVPLDHSVTLGPIAGGVSTSALVSTFATAGVNAVIVHKGRVRTIDPALFTRLALIVHVSAGTRHHADNDSKVLVGDVDDAVRYGADAVSVHVNVGSANEPAQLRDLAAVAQRCDALGMPLLAMMYARRADLPEDQSAETLAHLSAIAVDLGADLVKLSYPGSSEALSVVVGATPIPVLIAGGSVEPSVEANRERAHEVFAAGAAGVCFGRSVFESDDPLRVASTLVSCAESYPLGPSLPSSLTELTRPGATSANPIDRRIPA